MVCGCHGLITHELVFIVLKFGLLLNSLEVNDWCTLTFESTFPHHSKGTRAKFAEVQKVLRLVHLQIFRLNRPLLWSRWLWNYTFDRRKVLPIILIYQ